jgi:predicted metal-dependent hydrolase
MHTRYLDHSHRFWREVARACPGWREAERWLRRHGREI